MVTVSRSQVEELKITAKSKPSLTVNWFAVGIPANNAAIGTSSPAIPVQIRSQIVEEPPAQATNPTVAEMITNGTDAAIADIEMSRYRNAEAGSTA